MNSSGTVPGSTPVILAPPFEKLLTIQRPGKTAISVINLAGRVPFDTKVLSALAHVRGLRIPGNADIEVGECERTVNPKVKML